MQSQAEAMFPLYLGAIESAPEQGAGWCYQKEKPRSAADSLGPNCQQWKGSIEVPPENTQKSVSKRVSPDD